MINTCYQCGEYHPDKVIDPVGPYAICPNCGHRHHFHRNPLLLVGGASGAGKSAVCQFLLGKTRDVILLEGDLLWREEFNRPDENYREFFEMWLRMCKNISQSSYPVVLFNAGMAVPENIEPCIERRYFSKIYYLALVCDANELANRLRHRPAWRRSADPEFIKENIDFNRWLLENANKAEPAIDLMDTTNKSIEETADELFKWIQDHLEKKKE